MLKNFQEMYSLDISKDVQKKPTFKKENGKLKKMPEKYWLDYLEWATVLFLLHKNGAESVQFGARCNNDGYPAFFDQNGINPFVKVWVRIDGVEYEMAYPVINGNQVNSTPNQATIHNAQQRAFVKCVAINTGLGLKLWQKEESQLPGPETDDYDKLKALNDEVIYLFAEAVKKLGDADAVHEQIGTTKTTMNNLIKGDDISSKKAMIEQLKSI